METMALAQSLYENSFITYMRTDSSTLGQTALETALRTVESKFSPEYIHPHYRENSLSSPTQKKKQLNAQEAHEAIRPTTRVVQTPEGGTREIFVDPNESGLVGLEKKLYELIYSRTLTSVMAPAEFQTCSYQIKSKSLGNEGMFRASEKRLAFQGYQILSKNLTDNKPDQPMKSPTKNTKLLLSASSLPSKQAQEDDDDEFENGSPGSDDVDMNSAGIIITSHKTNPPLRYTESSFIRELEVAGVGRPSTYASILQTLKERGYIIVDKRTIIPTVKGVIVSNLLGKYFPEIVLPEFTSKMESCLDLIASGKLDKTSYLQTFYLGENGIGLKEKAVLVNEQSNSNSNQHHNKILDIPALREYGSLVYTGDNELILEKLEESKGRLDVKSRLRRWKIPVTGDIRSLTKEYMDEVLKKPSESEEFDPPLCPQYQAKPSFQPSRLIGVWNKKNIYLKTGRFGPYLVCEGVSW
jgi:DNA topoisomerase IA